MAKFYNTTRGPLGASLSSGASVSFPPKAWTEVDDADAASASLTSLLRKKFIVPSKLVAITDPEPTLADSVPMFVTPEVEQDVVSAKAVIEIKGDAKGETKKK
jgi:hypothetical protein